MASTQRNDMLDLDGFAAVVTGASGNIGAAIARSLHQAGAAVALHHSGTEAGEARANSLADELGDRSVVVAGDVERNAAAICKTVHQKFGRLDFVVNNAAIQPVVALVELEAADVSEMMRVNVGGPIAMTRDAALLMTSGGAIVNIASIEGLQPAVGHSHYAASKSALLMHTRAAARELGSAGIRVNAVSPGLVHVAGIEDAWPEGVARWATACPLGRIGQPDDVASAVLFLVSRGATWITGANLVVDGGVLTNNTW
jgi:NAD(P)-dependent dehydrogenase (short-subunit alcohol dehydrogenase family)